MKHDGGTIGAKTQTEYKYVTDQVIEAPDGEFKHLGRGAYEFIHESKPDAPEAGSPQTRLADGSPNTQTGVKTQDGK
jgi:hypothetical protein